MTEKILVLGATGILGEPVARRLLADGFQVRILARDEEKAHNVFGSDAEIVQGDVADLESLRAGMQGCSGVHVSVGGAVDQLSAENVASLAPELGTEYITYISGSTVCEQNGWYPMTRQKLNAEAAIRARNLDHTIFCPTWPMEQLPRFVMGGRATVIGVLPEPWHWFAAQDLARMVSRAYQTGLARNKRLYVHGPQAITVVDALGRYCQAFHPEIEEVGVMPIEAAKAMAEASGNAFIRVFAEMMDYFKKVGEPGEPGEANRLLGSPSITLDDWIEDRTREALRLETA